MLLSYDRLKGRWRCLLRRIDINVRDVPELVTACTISVRYTVNLLMTSGLMVLITVLEPVIQQSTIQRVV